MVSESKSFPLDPTGETYVKIRPPRFEDELERGRLRSKHTFAYDEQGFQVRQVDINLNHLWALEIWLTYEDTNLRVDIPREATEAEVEKGVAEAGGQITDTVSFLPRRQMNMTDFLQRLSGLPPNFVYHWHALVVDVVRQWADPFA